MKRIFSLFVATIVSLTAFGQWVSPGNGTYYSLSSLCISAYPAVSSPQSGTFQIHQNITISANDILCLESPTNDILIDNGVTITINGAILTQDRVNQLFISGDTTGTSFFTLCVGNAATANLSNVVFQYGHQIQLFNSGQVQFDNCVFSNFSDAVINYMNCNPTIQNCYFHDNQKAAITSAVNTAGSPKIIGNYFQNNDLSNANVPQINIGPGDQDTIVIMGNYIEGVAQNMSGGIGIMNMGASNTVLLVSGNVIENNRYGYTQNGTNIYAIIEDNIIRNNNLETNPNNGGSGISIYGTTTSCGAKIRRNLIHGNLWGITAIYNHNIDMGTAEDPGENVLYDNGNNNIEYELYNNSSCNMSAIGNYWGNNDVTHAEDVIYHQIDNSSYGLVTYSPIMEIEPKFLYFIVHIYDDNTGYQDIVFDLSQDSDTIYGTYNGVPDMGFWQIRPHVGLPLGVTCSPELDNPQDFTQPVSYTLTTPHGTSRTYVAVINFTEAVEDYETAPVTLSPNPVSGGQFTLRNESGKTMAVEVHSITGQLVYQAESTEESLSVTSSDWKKGMYLVTVIQDGKRKTFKVVNM
ncbi:MAG: T9SS type A sorting domain-containing protein [Bacteroidales bacterium]|nr:T9SS type A sorting domain-containing protein [Bacteroidales bacterium]